MIATNHCVNPGYHIPVCIGKARKRNEFFFLDLFILETERESVCAEGGAEGEGETVLSRLPTKHRARRGAGSHDPEIVTRAETKSWTRNWLSHPGAPKILFFSNTHIPSFLSIFFSPK